MGSLATFFMGLAGPMILRMAAALGISTLTFTGVTAGLQSLIEMATNNWQSLPSDVLQLASIAGIPQCIGIVCGAMTARVGMWVAVSATRFIVGGSA